MANKIRVTWDLEIGSGKEYEADGWRISQDGNLTILSNGFPDRHEVGIAEYVEGTWHRVELIVEDEKDEPIQFPVVDLS